MSYKKLWIALGFVLTVSFAVSRDAAMGSMRVARWAGRRVARASAATSASGICK